MKIENRQQMLVIVALTVVGLFVADKVLFTPLTNLWKARSQQINTLRVRVSEGSQMLRNEQRIRARWDDIRTNTLPVNTSLAEQRVFEAFDRWSRNSRVNINSLIPQWKQDSEEYKTLEFRVDASGDLRSLSRFLYELERDPLALKLQSVELASRDNAGQLLSLGLNVSALVLLPETQRPKR